MGCRYSFFLCNYLLLSIHFIKSVPRLSGFELNDSEGQWELPTRDADLQLWYLTEKVEKGLNHALETTQQILNWWVQNYAFIATKHRETD